MGFLEHTPRDLERILRRARRIAVLGARPEHQRTRAAYYVPAYLASVGYEVVPVPTDRAVLGLFGPGVVGSLSAVSPRPDIVSVFRRPQDVPLHLAELLAVSPPVVWFQSGLLHLESALALEAAGITVVHDCIACRRASIAPSTRAFEAR